MTTPEATREAAALDLHRAARPCLDALCARADPRTLAAVGGSDPHLALGIEMRREAPTLVLLAKQGADFLPQEVLRIGAEEFGADETRLVSVVRAVTNMLLEDLAPASRRQVVELVRSGEGFLSLYVLADPFAAALELRTGIEAVHLGQVAGGGSLQTLQ